MSKKLIYVAGPITKGDISDHVRDACFIGDRIMERGHAAIIPQLSILWQFITPHTWEQWLMMDDTIIRRCDALYRLPGASKGADREVALARSLHMPVFISETKLHTWLDRVDFDAEGVRTRSRTRAFHTHGGKL